MGNFMSSSESCPPTPRHLQVVLRDAAAQDPQRGLILYKGGDTSNPRRVSYKDLYTQAKRNALAVRSLDGFEEGRPILIHLHDHWDTILWLWSVLLASGLPVISSPFSNIDDHRNKHILGLSTLLESPICITNKESLSSFDCDHGLRLHTIESLARADVITGNDSFLVHDPRYPVETAEITTLLMLTSGSTGNAKAVKLSHGQILAAVAGKSSVRQLPQDRPLLNWIGMDHVASLVEIHIQALYLKVDQVHVYASDIVSSPTTFLDLLDRHHVSRSFAPNFFLAKLVTTLQSTDDTAAKWDLSSLTILASGGEANEVRTCVAVSKELEKHGARPDVVTPGFGMTETCAGAIFNMDCPRHDVANDRAAASLGKCMDGIEMRITVNEAGTPQKLAAVNEPGYLEVRGPVVFKGYYRNPQATAESILDGGWFRTGDQAAIDSNGNLGLIGRFKEVININGVKREVADVQTALEEALAGRVSRIVCFPSGASDTEQVTVAYIPCRSPMLPSDMIEITDLATQTCMLSTGSRPLVFGLGEGSLPLLPVSSLGKVSRAKMRTLFESGVFDEDVGMHNKSVQKYRKARQGVFTPPTESQIALINDMAQTLDGVNAAEIDPDTPIYDLGITSMDLIRLKNRIDSRLNIALPIILLMKHPTVRSLGAVLESYECPSQGVPAAVPYDPVVPFNSEGEKTPLWLVHPGVGEVLVFVGLAQHMAADQRPIYALRARGFERGQEPFANIQEAVQTYLSAIRERQPKGPYALAGYSYGTMLAFEISKQLEAAGEEVGFLGSFNLPPNIKQRMRQLSWNMCLLHLAQFLALVTEQYAEAMEDVSDFRDLPRGKALRHVLDASDRARLEELALPEQGLERWADVAFGLQSMAVDYEPSGSAGVIDIFHAIPLKLAARCPQEWVHEHLAKWKDFCRSPPTFRPVGGAHYTMLGPDHVEDFSAELMKALRERGL